MLDRHRNINTKCMSCMSIFFRDVKSKRAPLVKPSYTFEGMPFHSKFILPIEVIMFYLQG